MDNQVQAFEGLLKALEAGGYDAAPSTLTQGSALQIENLSPVMNNVTYDNQHIKLQKMLEVKPCKATLAQFDRQLSYGIFGGSAQAEGFVGQEETSQFVRITVPMAFYAHTRRVTIASTMVATVDGKKSDERAASDAALKIAGDIEFDLFRGLDDFSNAGVFDGNPLVIPSLPNIHGLNLQVRQSDFQTNAQDLMFSEYGSSDSVVLQAGGPLTQSLVEDASLRSSLNMGMADKLVVDPVVLSTYNKLALGKERIILQGSPQGSTGADLRKQWVSGGTVSIEATQWLRGKTSPQTQRTNGPIAPATVTPSVSSGTTPFQAGDVYLYYVTTGNETGESSKSPTVTGTITANGQKVSLAITNPAGNVRFFNVYRSVAGGTLATSGFIGRVIVNGTTGGTTTFTDLGNRSPRFVTGTLVQGDTMNIEELAPYSRLKLAVTDLSLPEAHYRFLSLATEQPRKNVLLDNLQGSF